MAVLMSLGSHNPSCQRCLTCPWGLIVDWVCIYNGWICRLHSPAHILGRPNSGLATSVRDAKSGSLGRGRGILP